jgi:DNA-binding CsgD family transcriptional regulator
VLELMREELTTAQMAERLYVSQVTVRTHISSILRKLRLPNRAAIRRLFNDR